MGNPGAGVAGSRPGSGSGKPTVGLEPTTASLQEEPRASGWLAEVQARTRPSELCERSVMTETAGNPIGLAVDGANRNDCMLTERTISSIPIPHDPPSGPMTEVGARVPRDAVLPAGWLSYTGFA